MKPLKRHPFDAALIAALLIGGAWSGAGCASSPKADNASQGAAIAPAAANPNHETLVILGTNDIHGALAPLEYKSREDDPSNAVEYTRGGAAVFAAHVKALRQEFGDRLLWLDAGDQFQGSLESNLDQGASVTRFFSELGLAAASVGNHEFDFGRDALQARIAEAKYPYLAANIVPPLPGTRPHILINAGKLKVGIVGLSTLETPTTTRPEYVKDLKFTSLKEALIRESKALRSAGADVVLLTAHVGLVCKSRSSFETAIRAANNPSQTGALCGEKDEMVELLRSVPAGTVDAVVSGHTHQVVHHWISGVPVIQGGGRGMYYNLIHLTFDTAKKKLLSAETRIEGPIPVCAEVFQNQGDCNGEQPAPRKGRGPLVRPTFHGKELEPDSATERLLRPTFERVEREKKRWIADAARAITHRYPCSDESEAGNLIADAMREKAAADFAMLNCGMVRGGFEKGAIRFGDLFRVIPFDNAVRLLRVNGKQLKLILQVANSGARGFFPVSGLRLKLLDMNQSAHSSDLNGDGKIEAWEIDRLVDVTRTDGAPIEDDEQYTLATVDFLVSGGDNMGWPMGRIPKSQIQPVEGGLIRDVVEGYLAAKHPLNTEEAPLIREDAPRITFTKVDSGPKSKKSRKTSHKTQKRKKR